MLFQSDMPLFTALYKTRIHRRPGSFLLLQINGERLSKSAIFKLF
jgi:hypothetical protein